MKFKRLIAGTLATLAALAGEGCGGGSGPPISVRDSEVRAECLSGTFVPGNAGLALDRNAPPRNWREIEGAPGAVQADRGAVEVVISPRRGQKAITLTGIDFQSTYKRRPLGGAVFYRPCKRRLRGAAIEFDLDSKPIRILASEPATVIQGPLGLSRGTRRISFPWTVSLDKPLRLYLVVNADGSYRVWRAQLKWRDGSQEGSVAIDNGGRDYRVVDTIGVGWLKPNGSQWVPARNFAEGN